MAQTVIFPKLGQTMEEGAIVKWLKREGDAVAKGDGNDGHWPIAFRIAETVASCGACWLTIWIGASA